MFVNQNLFADMNHINLSGINFQLRLGACSLIFGAIQLG
jgi:hypothetical protein